MVFSPERSQEAWKTTSFHPSCCGGGVHTEMGGQDYTSDEILCSRNMEPPDLKLEQAPDGTAWSRLVHSPLLAWFGSSPPSLSQAHTLSASLCLSLSLSGFHSVSFFLSFKICFLSPFWYPPSFSCLFSFFSFRSSFAPFSLSPLLFPHFPMISKTHSFFSELILSDK